MKSLIPNILLWFLFSIFNIFPLFVAEIVPLNFSPVICNIFILFMISKLQFLLLYVKMICFPACHVLLVFALVIHMKQNIVIVL